MKRPAPARPPAPADTRPPFLVHVERLVEDLHGHVPKALNHWDEQSIHQARVATRRLSAALALTKPRVGKKRRRALAQVLRRLRRRLGPLRDADVMLGQLTDLAAKSPKLAPPAAWLSRRLCAEREALRQASAEQGPASGVLADLGAWYPVREEMAESVDALPTLLAESLHLQLDAFVDQADAIAGRARPVKVDAPEQQGPRDPHQLRIAGKALRYMLEMAAAQGHEVGGAVMKTFKKMQEGLGGWHDFVVLTDKAMRASLDAALAHQDAATQEGVLGLARATLRTSTQQLGQFNRLWTAKGEALALTIRAAFPLTGAGTRVDDGGGGRAAAAEAPAEGRAESDNGAAAAEGRAPPGETTAP